MGKQLGKRVGQLLGVDLHNPQHQILDWNFVGRKAAETMEWYSMGDSHGETL